MKKLFVVTILLLCISLTGCSTLFPTDIDGNTSKSTTVKIIYPNSEETLEVTYNEIQSFTPKYIENKVLVGFYGDVNALGYEYFNYMGEMNGSWKKEYPSSVYAVYTDIDYSLSYTSSISCHENPRSYYCAGYTVRLGSISKNDDFYPTIYCNSNMDVIVTLYAEIKQNGPYASRTTVKFGMGAETFKEVDFDSQPTGYTLVSISHTIKAKQLTTSGVFVNFDWHDGSIGSYGLVKNVYYQVTLVAPSMN